MTKKTETTAEVKTEAVKFPKETILKTKRFASVRDILHAILDDEKEYTMDEVEKAVDKWMKGKVN